MRDDLPIPTLMFVLGTLVLCGTGCNPDSQGVAPSVSSSQLAPSSNRLAQEKSPYLLQHAENPVHWYPWGEEAFARAKAENKPIFLSVGYSTCHWCHVMAHESFENLEIAATLNEHFVSIKVDREERPDVDHLYMQAVMALTGRGGWPMSVFLTPDGEPFFGGTYFPPEDRFGQPGFKSVLRNIAQVWQNRREEILKSGRSMVEAIQAQEKAQLSKRKELDSQVLEKAFRAFETSYDDRFGGFLPPPKFPRSHSLSFLLRYYKRTGEPQALEMVEKTLMAMAAGGMWDQLGGGFHRYSTDGQWRVPHFEKMLYDQALLATTYLEAYQVTGKAQYAQVARRIFDYVLNEMTDSQGGFYSAEDADSIVDPAHPKEKAEGAFYVWSFEELTQRLGDETAAWFAYRFGATPQGNALEDPMGELVGKNILYQAHTVEETAQKFNQSVEKIQKAEGQAREKLLAARSQRPRPGLDDKILVDWNGLMISALSFGARVLEEPRYAQAAQSAAEFILKELVREDGRLLHRYRDQDAGILGQIEDYAFLIHGLIDLYQATFEVSYLKEAKRLTEQMLKLFWDSDQGGLFLTGSDAEALLVRQKELYDGAIPSGNSVAALDLLRLGRLTAESSLEEKCAELFSVFSGLVDQSPSAFSQLLVALDFGLGPSNEIVIAGEASDTGVAQMLKVVYAVFLPNKVVLLHPESGEQIEALAPFLKGQVAFSGKATAYVCQNYACNLPTTDLEKLKTLIAP